MAKNKKSAKGNGGKLVPERVAQPVDPHAVLRHPAAPPRPHVVGFLIAIVAFFAWFVFLVYVAIYG